MYLDLLRESGRVIGSGLGFFHPYSSVKQSTCFAKIHRTFTVWVTFKCTSLFLKDNLKTKFIFYLHYHFLANPKKSNVFTTTSFFVYGHLWSIQMLDTSFPYVLAVALHPFWQWDIIPHWIWWSDKKHLPDIQPIMLWGFKIDGQSYLISDISRTLCPWPYLSIPLPSLSCIHGYRRWLTAWAQVIRLFFFSVWVPICCYGRRLVLRKFSFGGWVLCGVVGHFWTNPCNACFPECTTNGSPSTSHFFR